MQKIFYYEGEDFNYKTFIIPGIISEEKNCFVIKTRENDKYIKKLELRNLKEFDLVKVYGVGYVIKVRLYSGKILYLGAYKGVCLLNFFLRVDEKKTIRLAEKIVYKFKDRLKWFKNRKETK